jgi:hypothetical protein
MISFNDFYLVTDTQNNKCYRLEPTTSDKCFSHVQAIKLFRGKLLPQNSLSLQAFSGSQVCDILWTGFPPLVCFSRRVIDLLTAEKISGWSTFPVQVFSRKDEPIPDYYGFSVTSKECRRDFERSELIPYPGYSGYGPKMANKGLFFCEEDWDGSDIFLIWPGMIIFSEKVYKLFAKENVKNVKLIPLPEVLNSIVLDDFLQRDWARKLKDGQE